MSENENDQPKPVHYMSPLQALGSSIITLTNPDDELYHLELTYRNVTIDNRGNTKPLGPPLMNNDGIGRMIGLTRSFVNKIHIMGTIDKIEKSGLLLNQAQTIQGELMINWKIYGIDKRNRNSTRSTISTAAMNICIVTANRALNEGDRRFWKGSTHEITTRMDQGSTKKGLMSRVMGWGKT